MLHRLLTYVLLIGFSCSLLPALVRAQPYYVYIARIETDSFILAWGVTEDDFNSIGFNSTSLATARVEIPGRPTLTEEKRNWVKVTALEPDQEYRYEVFLEGHGSIGSGSVRTYPKTSNRLAFFVIGDFGNGKDEQYELADVMYQIYQDHNGSAPDNPIRFVLTTGDNIYGDKLFGFLGGGFRSKTGNKDSHWEKKFFRPYQDLIRSIPFRPSPGNHDGRAAEKSEDLPVYWDNFFIKDQPSDPGYYSFRFGGLAEFFSIDSTDNEIIDGNPGYAKGGKQEQWLENKLKEAQASNLLWKIPYFHHPIYTAGPSHPPDEKGLGHFLEHFQNYGVQVVFTGHEHNFQISDSDLTEGIAFIVTGAGGQLREQKQRQVQRMLKERNIAAWAPKRHFLLVVIEDNTMTIMPYGRDGNPLDLIGSLTPPIVITQ